MGDDALDRIMDSILGDGEGDAPTSSYQGAPDAMYDPQGRYFEFIGGQWVPNPQFDDPTQAAGYQAPRAPRTYAPRYPTTEITPAGDIFTIDPYSGIPTYMGNDPRLATGLSPSQQRSNQVFDQRQAYDFEREMLGLQQGYNTSERLGSQQFQSGENALDRNFTAGQNALDRALSAADMAASINAQNQANAFAADQAYQQAQERYTQTRLGAAQQVANNISNVDPGALPAFYEAGGGVIANALDVGATGRTPLSDYGSAAALRVAETAQAPERFEFTPIQFDPAAYFNLLGGLIAPPAPVAAPQQSRAPRRFSQPAGLGGTPSREEMAAAKPKVQEAANRGDAQFVGQEGGRWRLVNGEWVEAFARGGSTDNRMIVTGDHPSGKQNEELVFNPTGAPIMVVPLSKMGQAGREMAKGAPHAATGFASDGAASYAPPSSSRGTSDGGAFGIGVTSNQAREWGFQPGVVDFLSNKERAAKIMAAHGDKPRESYSGLNSRKALEVFAQTISPSGSRGGNSEWNPYTGARTGRTSSGAGSTSSGAFGAGTTDGGTSGNPVDAGMDSYLERIGEIRDNVQFPNLNPFDVRFALNAPSQLARYFQGMQTKYAIPVEDQQAEARRFALSGVSRGGLTLGT